MEEILHAFGINGKLIVIQIVNFAILAGFLTYFLYNPILKLLNERENKIRRGIEHAEEAEKALAAADTEKAHILASAHKDAESISSRAKIYADEKVSRIIEDANVKAQHILQNADMRGKEMQAQARKESEAEIAKTAVLLAEKILREKNT